MVLQNILCKYIFHALGLDIVFIQRVWCFLSPSLGYLQKIFFSERTNRTLARKFILCNLCETGWAWMTEKLFSLISFWQWTSNCYKMWQLSINYVHSITTYMQLWFCVPLFDWCMALPFVMCSIVKNIWALGMWASSLFLSWYSKTSVK